ncbi:hypothetical protein [Streptomyces sp. NBC_00233]|uniref:hypothetical protein n=1 Tax=Streptomyces sp. NBC_00233 TaxID=2975686 RepID=UPI00224DA285|nr:hypothetical protein [Streptomyces sp. NBC_00233]MCX5229690.1 hypothetical protein [Streptomyces sp. NBC_00233]
MIRHLAGGCEIVARQRSEALAAWVQAGRRDDLTGWKAALGPIVRLVLLGAAASAVVAAVRALPWLMWLLTGWWLRAAWKATPTPAQEEPEGTEEAPTTTAPEAVYDATLAWVRDQVGDRNGVHLSDLLTHAHAHDLLTDLDLPAFRATLERWGIPVRQQLKVGGKNRPGVHRDDLPSASSSTAATPAAEAA